MLNDCETIDLLLGLLNDADVGWRDVWGRRFEKEEVVQALRRMTADGSVRVLVSDRLGRRLQELTPIDWSMFNEDTWWFDRTERGHDELAAWTPR